MMEWQKLESQQGFFVYRSKVPGGWLVWAHWRESAGSLTFYPDPEYKWDGGSVA